jgi:glycosyltransferase involved in cell wall biosynthesis
MADPGGPPRILFFANASRDSTDGRRVRQFHRRIQCAAESAVLYRDDYGKLRSMVVLLRETRRLRPHLVYVELFGYSGVVGGMLAKLLFGPRLGIGNGDELTSTHVKAGRHLRALIARGLELMLLSYADLWAAWSPYQARWLRRRGARNVVCVPGAVDREEIALVDASALKRRLGLDGQLVVGVVGYLSYSRELDMAPGWDLIEALHLLGDLPVSGLIVGDGPGLERLTRLAAGRGVLSRVAFTGRVPHHELAAYYSVLDVGLVTLSNDLDGKFTWTAKLPEYLACNVFPVMTDIDRSRSFVRRCGALLPFNGAKDPVYPARLAALIRELVEEPRLLQRRINGGAIASALMDFDVASRHLARGIARVTRKRRSVHLRPAGSLQVTP